ncbi:MAG: peptidase M64 N-terminal domain-containing protein, partial [Planctomycetota bacterium]
MNVTGLLLAACLAQSIDFDTEFTGTTLRFDYHHCGTAGQEQIAPDATIEEGPWAGRRRKFPGHAAKGKYAFVVLDQATHRPLYQDGFSSIYGEW